MIPAIASGGASFKGAFAYYFHDNQATSTERIAWTQTRNMLTRCVDKAWKVMAYTAKAQARLKEAAGRKRTGRKLTKPVFCYSLAWHPEQRPSKAEMLAAAEKSLKTLGLSEHETAIAAHNDEPHPHIHLVVNRINPITGIAKNMSHSKRKLSDFAREYEREGGKIYCPKREENHEKRKRGKATKYVDPHIAGAWENSRDAKDFKELLEAKGYDLAQGRKRVVVVDPHGKAINPVRHLEGVRTKEFNARMEELDTRSLPTVDMVNQRRSSENDKKEQTVQRYEEKVAEAITAQISKHSEARAALSDAHHRRIEEKRVELTAHYGLEKKTAEIDRLKRQLETPGLLRKIAQKVLGTDRKTIAKISELEASRANAHTRFTEAIGKLETRHDTALQHLDERQSQEQKKLEARLTAWKPTEKFREASKPDKDLQPSRTAMRDANGISLG